MSLWSKYETPLTLVALLTVPVLALLGWALYFLDETLYRAISWENGPVEGLTFAFLLVAAGIAFVTLARHRKAHGETLWFVAAFGVVCLLLAAEEISWGQRMLGLRPPDLFQEYNVQHEINLHNFFPTLFHVSPRQAYAIVDMLYGVTLPLLARVGGVGRFLRRHRIVVPPLALVPGFLIAGVMAFFDRPTGREEEYAELYLSMCFMFVALAEYARVTRQSAAVPLERAPA